MTDDLKRVHLLQAEREAVKDGVLVCTSPKMQVFRFVSLKQVSYGAAQTLEEVIVSQSKRIAALEQTIAELTKTTDANIAAITKAIEQLNDEIDKGNVF